MTSKELRGLDARQRMMKVYEFRHEMLQLRLRAVSEHLPSFAARRRMLRKAVARALTIQNELSKVR